MDASDLNEEYDSGVEEHGAGEGEDDRSGADAASFLVRGGSVESDEDDEGLGWTSRKTAEMRKGGGMGGVRG